MAGPEETAGFWRVLSLSLFSPNFHQQPTLLPEQMLPFLSLLKDLVPSSKDSTQSTAGAAEGHPEHPRLSGTEGICWEGQV